MNLAWRAETGRQWHATLAGQAKREQPGVQTEWPIEGVIRRNGWELRLSGRVDQYLPSIGRIREIKTVRDLEPDPQTLRLRWPEYFVQASLYQMLLESLSWKNTSHHSSPFTELVFVDIRDGMTVSVAIDAADLDACRQHIDAFLTFLEFRVNRCRHRIADASNSPYQVWRPGQESIYRQLLDTLNVERAAFLEAPTGFGKTGIALDSAIQLMKRGEIDRVLYLTSKSTGKVAAHNYLQIRIQEAAKTRAGSSVTPGTFPPEVTWITIQSKRANSDSLLRFAELTIDEARERWRAEGIRPAELFTDGTIPEGFLEDLSKRAGIEPFEVTRFLLGYADVWIADYNYLFQAGPDQVFIGQPDWDPTRTMVIVDEAHNLPSRVEDAWSYRWHRRDIAELSSWIAMEAPGSPLMRELDRLLSEICAGVVLAPSEPDQVDRIESILDRITNLLKEQEVSWASIPDEQCETLWEIASAWEAINDPLNPVFHYKPSRQIHCAQCLDASALIHRSLDNMARVLFLSATPGPMDAFQLRCGWQNEPLPHIESGAHWIAESFSVAVDTRVNTRYRFRDASMPLSAQTIADLKHDHGLPVVAFVPSFEYATRLDAALQLRSPWLRMANQPRELKQHEQSDWIQSALSFHDVIILVMGSRFGEAIDQLGGEVERAVVISPGLPTPDLVLKERQHRFIGSSAEKFRHFFQIPGMNRVIQSMGRLVREPDHKVFLVLQCERFAEQSYQNLLPAWARGGTLVSSEEDWASWLDHMNRRE